MNLLKKKEIVVVKIDEFWEFILYLFNDVLFYLVLLDSDLDFFKFYLVMYVFF